MKLNKLFAVASVAVASLFVSEAQAQSCEITKSHGIGYTTTLEAVTQNPNGTYSIDLRVEHDGCPGPTCKELSHYSIEADQGTYSNVSVAVNAGSFSYGNIDMGHNLGGDPIDGFKLDNTSNIGDGQAGSFTVTYTLTSLQDQRTLVKAGPNRLMVQFTQAEFTQVMNCMATPDTDGDGITDDLEDFPNDADRAFSSNWPCCGSATLAYEDLWPSQGDYDFNDLVIDYQFETVTNSNNYVVEVFATFEVIAFGAGYHNGFGFQFANNNVNAADITVTGMNTSGLVNLAANGLENGQNKPTIIVFEDSYDVMSHPGAGIGVNTTPSAPSVPTQTITITMTFAPNTYTANDLDLPNFNPFIFVNQTRGREIHLPNYAPTDLADPSYFGTGNDDSNPSTGRYYKNGDNLPWAINVVSGFDHMKEKVEITSGYFFFFNWAASNGTTNQYWNLPLPGYINSGNIY